ncbi:MAG: hypothetical protein A2481_00210 [Candidatus Yonathbacteria bacterium RIFOXYC2_FULL_47_9]|uniref:Response regulatory domain-containing protein n=1 Tax=Candidatus Lloydbacteria bacterium RIFOXYC12_FULL_46_25 TaxID=1798670 RepID=A0A1G2E115_9BACT|nr:MAG: hypothetical protein A2494_01390 [Candidatus Lloydbacteria bacterium RIFOXYC12_FULL_46_25]OHA84945.1 MAG: hypothetical protein A2481_00210 [Candidatus Yonathbacteria bacterium RIFOXYC2_FULL_47_9]
MTDNTQKKILIIEDDEHISKIYDIKLKSEGMNVTIARDGVEGLEKVESEDPALILLDLMIPKKDGFEVLAEIKKMPKRKNVPVIVLSNLGQQSDVDRVMALGAVDYLVKANLSFQEVVAKIRQHLGAA